MSRRITASLIAASAALLTSSAQALTVLDDQRSVRAHRFSSCGTTSCSSSETKEVVHPGGSLFQAGVDAGGAYAWQSSRTLVDGIVGHGGTTSSIAVDILETESHSRLEIELDLDSATLFALFGSVEASGDPDFGQGLATATVRLSDGLGDLFVFSVSATDTSSSSPFDESIVLGPGTYTLFAEARQDYPSSGLASGFEVRLVVPEPGSGSLIGLGLVLMAWGRRRQFMNELPGG